MTILVTGGAGYIGSHVALALLDRGERVVVLDNLSSGLREQVPLSATFIEGDSGNPRLLTSLLRAESVEAVLHFAGSLVVPESVENPLEYYRNNTSASRNLIAECISAGINKFIFSSTAAVYGVPERVPVAEMATANPINPYGRSKLMIEWMLQDVSLAHDFRYAALRYFNVAGADPMGRSGQSTHNATHLIKRACQVALGRLHALDIYGIDFPTHDGTGVRDYIHVADLASAHLLMLDYLRGGGESICVNAGYGSGFSVLEVIDAVQRVSGNLLSVVHSQRRPGDPPVLISDPTILKQKFGWVPRYCDLEEIVRSALVWESRLS